MTEPRSTAVRAREGFSSQGYSNFRVEQHFGCGNGDADLLNEVARARWGRGRDRTARRIEIIGCARRQSGKPADLSRTLNRAARSIADRGLRVAIRGLRVVG